LKQEQTKTEFVAAQSEAVAQAGTSQTVQKAEDSPLQLSVKAQEDTDGAVQISLDFLPSSSPEGSD